LITRAKPQLRWGHGWTRNSAQEISIFRNEINVLLDFESGVNVARDFTGSTQKIVRSPQNRHEWCASLILVIVLILVLLGKL
jgi:hypothetical protein